jgi:hypothetical protein
MVLTHSLKTNRNRGENRPTMEKWPTQVLAKRRILQRRRIARGTRRHGGEFTNILTVSLNLRGGALLTISCQYSWTPNECPPFLLSYKGWGGRIDYWPLPLAEKYLPYTTLPFVDRWSKIHNTYFLLFNKGWFFTCKLRALGRSN